MPGKLTEESATTLLALLGVELEPERAEGVARTLNLQVDSTGEVFAALPFEIEPSTFLKVSTEETP